MQKWQNKPCSFQIHDEICGDSKQEKEINDIKEEQ